jgi:endonuclease/exonuclease/phosphatase family metal-dependent hydrolase
MSMPCLLAVALHLLGGVDAASARTSSPPDAARPLRIATFNCAMNRDKPGQLAEELRTPESAQAKAVAEIIQRVAPDVILLNEFDYDERGAAIDAFLGNYLARPQNGAASIEYPFVLGPPSNTGVPSGRDLDHDGRVGGPGDAIGFGAFEGQYAFVVLSRVPIDFDHVRTFRNFLWKQMPGARLPGSPPPDGAASDNPRRDSKPSELPPTPDRGDWYSSDDLAVLRLSSKNHCDVPLRIGDSVVHLLVSHPTPPVFDGPEDRNGRRNHDEIRLWADYIDPARCGYVVDDANVRGGLAVGEPFVILGDLNADPLDGDSTAGAARQLLEHPLIDASRPPTSRGGLAAALAQGGANLPHNGNPARDTGDFADSGDHAPGNLRIDYVLPSKSLVPRGGGIFWPEPADELFRLVGDGRRIVSSDHRLVWVDVELAPRDPEKPAP